MDASKHGRELLDPERPSAQELDEALVHWDDLEPEALERLAAHPRSAAKLRTLQLADAWLREQGSSERPAAVAHCPEADELYDYGRGPGARPLAAARRAEIDRHVLSCADCRGTVASLARRPPAVLDLGGAPATLSAPARPAPGRLAPLLELAERRRRKRLRAAAPLAAAALVLIAAALLLRPGAPQPDGGLPVPPVLRGAEADALVSPRGRLLAAGGAASWTGLAARPVPLFEIAPEAGGSAYRVELRRSSGAALDEGELIAALELAPPVASQPFAAAAGPALEPGRYTWRAFATVRGLERELGARDFEVAADPGLEAALAALAGAREPARTEAAVRLLDERGHLADARALARTLPASPEREAYLGRAPGR